MGQVNGVFIFRGAPTNGAEAKLWHVAGFVSPPEYEDPEPNPVHQEGATLTTGIEYGGDGGYRWASVPDGEYYVSCYYQNHRVWIYASTETITDILTTQGDLLVEGASGLERLARGDDGQLLKMVSGAPAWADAAPAITKIVDAHFRCTEYLVWELIGEDTVPASANKVLGAVCFSNDGAVLAKVRILYDGVEKAIVSGSTADYTYGVQWNGNGLGSPAVLRFESWGDNNAHPDSHAFGYYTGI